MTENSDRSVWSYRLQANGIPNNTIRDGNYELLLDRVRNPCTYSPNGLEGWCDSSGGNGTVEMPQIVKNTSTSTNNGIRPRETALHPDENQIVVVSWLARRSGTIKISFEFADLLVGSTPYEDGVTWYVDLGDASGNLAAGVLLPGATTGYQSVTDVAVVAGERVHFVVGPNGSELWKSWFDMTRLKAVIEYTDGLGPPVADPAADFSWGANATSNAWACIYQADGLSNNLARDGNYEPLFSRISRFYGLSNVTGWAAGGASLPAVVLNTNISPATNGSLKLEPSGLLLHPAPNQLVGMQWNAPRDGQVTVQFKLEDLDWGGGDGVDWYFQQPRLGRDLASGSVNRADSATRSVTAEVVAGEKLCFLVSPKGADHTYDSTGLWANIQYQTPLNLSIAAENGMSNTTRVTWSFQRDQSHQLYRALDIGGPWYPISFTTIGLSGQPGLSNSFQECPIERAAFFTLNHAGTDRPMLSLDGSSNSLSILDGIPPAYLNARIGSRTFAEWSSKAQLTATSAALDANRTLLDFIWSDASGLEISCEAIRYSDFAAIEWLMWVRNKGTGNSPVLQELCPLDAVFALESGNTLQLHSWIGGQSSATGFCPEVSIIGQGTSKTLRNSNGRSSDETMPYFEFESGQAGIIFAVGWSGQWLVETAGILPDKYRLLARQESLQVRLRPGEAIRSPRMLALAYSEGPTAGINSFRRFMHRYVLPQNTNAQVPAIQMNLWYIYGDNVFSPINETNVVRLLETYHLLGIDTAVIDACWNGESWWSDCGNWTPDTNRFPNGLSPVGQAATNLAMRLGLWFELEKAAGGTTIWREHPELFIRATGWSWSLLDLGMSSSRDWYLGTLDGYMSSTPLGYYKHDFNINPKLFWRAKDREDGIGLTENLYVQGLYAALDELRAMHPDVVFEGCSSGGRRMDWEMLRRVDYYFKSDSWFNPEAHQCHIMGGGAYLPANYLLSPFKSYDSDPYAFRSQLGAALSCGWDPDAADYSAALAADRVREYKSLRHLFRGDFYPLFEHSTSDGVWAGWQFHRADLDEGMAVVFRRPQATNSSESITLKGLNSAALYDVMWVDAGITNRVGGASLSQPMTVTLSNQPGSALIFYHKATP